MQNTKIILKQGTLLRVIDKNGITGEFHFYSYKPLEFLTNGYISKYAPCKVKLNDILIFIKIEKCMEYFCYYPINNHFLMIDKAYTEIV